MSLSMTMENILERKRCFSEHFENCIPQLSKMLGDDTLYYIKILNIIFWRYFWKYFYKKYIFLF